MVLADHGAEVVRIDRPGGDPCRRAGAFSTWDRGKHSAEFDLRDEHDLAAVLRLASEADVVVDGLGAGRLDALGLGEDALRAVNPRHVYDTAPLAGVRILELSSFFASPYGNRLLADLGADVVKVEPPGGDPQRGLPDPAENVNARKRSIVVDLKHDEARPVVERLVSWADVVGHNTGLLSAVGTLLALIHRERTGVAQYVEVSQLLATVFTVSEMFRDLNVGPLQTTEDCVG